MALMANARCARALLRAALHLAARSTTLRRVCIKQYGCTFDLLTLAPRRAPAALAARAWPHAYGNAI